MTCNHISKALDKINDLITRANNDSSTLYRKLGPIVDEKTINPELRGGFWDGYSASTSYKSYYFPYISQSSLYENLSNIFDELKSCNCRNDLVKDYNNLNGNSNDKYSKLVNEYNELLGKHKENIKDYNNLVNNSRETRQGLTNDYNELVGKFNNLKEKHDRLDSEGDDLRDDRDNWKSKYEEKSEELQNEKLRNANEIGNEKLKQKTTDSALENKIARLEEKLESKSSQLIGVARQLEDSKSEFNLVRIENNNAIARIENKLDQKQQLLETVRQSLANLQVDHEREKAEKDIEINAKESELREKENELRRKEEEIKNSQNQAGKSHEELLTEKLRSEKGNLELLANELKINLEQIHGLVKYHERLFQAQRNYNQANIDTHEENITRIKQEFQDLGISMVNIQEISRKCERIAELIWELEQSKQQYEARQEVPVNH